VAGDREKLQLWLSPIARKTIKGAPAGIKQEIRERLDALRRNPMDEAAGCMESRDDGPPSWTVRTDHALISYDLYERHPFLSIRFVLVRLEGKAPKPARGPVDPRYML
jgi:hypothetical protein